MPGAFAHITAVNVAAANSTLKTLNMPRAAKRVLSQHKKYIELGSVSPDYPYLTVTDTAQSLWADRMHYDAVGELLAELVEQVRACDAKEKDKAFAWLCGFIAHVAADITIHPVVELKVGPYAENKNDHRICEMHQDAYVWVKHMNLGELGYADRVKANIGTCSDPNNEEALDPTLCHIWATALSRVHADVAQTTPPNINAWHHGFLFVVDLAEESDNLFAWARHVAAKLGLTYPQSDEVDMAFIQDLATPEGTQHYDAIFERAIGTIHQLWEQVAAAVYDDAPLTAFKNWNLDTGHCEDGQLTAWS